MDVLQSEFNHNPILIRVPKRSTGIDAIFVEIFNNQDVNRVKNKIV